MNHENYPNYTAERSHPRSAQTVSSSRISTLQDNNECKQVVIFYQHEVPFRPSAHNTPDSRCETAFCA